MNPFNLYSVNHKDGIKTNNNVDNLEWLSLADNNRHALATGIGFTEGTDEIVALTVITLKNAGLNMREISRRCNLSYDRIKGVCVRGWSQFDYLKEAA